MMTWPHKMRRNGEYVRTRRTAPTDATENGGGFQFLINHGRTDTKTDDAGNSRIVGRFV